ncbi:uncharacterized protein LOC143877084 isoform X3 [Tasmannia lanceolata]|uniref:uncharacterized protein LOC143877084 isoform X3 n=1 Tax=Tasmannia lanceolata TaxID=3420 RepID=UPI004064B4F7
MADPLVGDPSLQDEHYEFPFEENNNYGAHVDRFLSSNVSKSGETKEGTHVSSTTSMGSITSAEQYEILPLTGNPYFVSIITNMAVKSPYQLDVFFFFLPISERRFQTQCLGCFHRLWLPQFFTAETRNGRCFTMVIKPINDSIPVGENLLLTIS